MSAATRDVVRARLSAMERPHLVARGALTEWVASLPPSGYATVAALLSRVPAHRITTSSGDGYGDATIGQVCGVATHD